MHIDTTGAGYQNYLLSFLFYKFFKIVQHSNFTSSVTFTKVANHGVCELSDF